MHAFGVLPLALTSIKLQFILVHTFERKTYIYERKDEKR